MLATEPRPVRSTLTVASLLRGAVATVAPTATLREAAEALAADEVGLLVVVDPGGLRGVLSERDLVRAVAAGADLEVERVRDHAACEVVTVPDRATLVEAARAMLDAGVRHLVVEHGPSPVGVVSVRDVLPALLAPTAAAG